MRLVVALALKAGGPMTAAELQEHLPDVPPATLYRHLNALRERHRDGGRGGEAGRGSGPEAWRHRTPLRAQTQGAASLGPADLANATPDDHLRWFASFVAGLLGAFGRYVAAGPPDLARDGVGYREVVLQLSDAELVSMSVALNAALMPFVVNPPAEGRTALFATVLLPADPMPRRTQRGTLVNQLSTTRSFC